MLLSFFSTGPLEQQEEKEDELFWNQDALKEEENNDNYVEEAEVADQFDSYFDEDEPEPDEEGENDAEERTVRKSTRTAVIVRQAERDAIRAALQATMKPIKWKKEGEEKGMTQEEMLSEAAQTDPKKVVCAVTELPANFVSNIVLKMALEAKNLPVNVYVGMRYRYPFTEEAVQQLDQMEECIYLIMQKLKDTGVGNDHTLAYQSQVGPVQWLKPYSDEVLVELGQKGVKESPGGSSQGRVPALNCTSSFITDLADAVLEALPAATIIYSARKISDEDDNDFL
ncbi:hypothetical protein Patl1_24386 [Pistacia atlantica]|uniref:Uncharacterized protein n=1 Tax=Pistacia atlantica TaxID=434234 RepID=A0ACC0ZX95_9ROSI|nr:hypothetical protein Patl1_24386 [Pistacia atlantica]